MSTFHRRLIYVLLGLAGGLAAWPAMELVLALQQRFPSYLLFSVGSGALFGAVYGLFFGFADGVIAANGRRTLTGGAFGALWGLIGGAVGFVLGQWLLLSLGGYLFRQGVALDSGALPLTRVLGWAVLGVFVGTTEGVRKRSPRKLGIGLISGFLGGALGGVLVEYSGAFVSEAQGRPLGLLLFGLLVAFAYGLVEKSLAFGILRLLNGTYKGKEFILNQRNISIGSSRGADVPLFSYRRVMENHARIRASGQDIYLYPEDPETEVKHNDSRLSPEGTGPLKYGDVLQVGSAKLLYLP
jgi:hypothetical protein